MQVFSIDITGGNLKLSGDAHIIGVCVPSKSYSIFVGEGGIFCFLLFLRHFVGLVIGESTDIS